MTESGAARLGDSQGRNLLRKHLGEIPASQTSHPSIEKPCSIGGPSRRPTAIKAALRRRRAGDVWLGRLATGKTRQELYLACPNDRPNHIGIAVQRHLRA
jgi:hypothetical protein